MNRPNDAVGAILARYGLVVVLAWFGVLKFMAYEAQGIQPLVSKSPLMSWLYDVFSLGAARLVRARRGRAAGRKALVATDFSVG